MKASIKPGLTTVFALFFIAVAVVGWQAVEGMRDLNRAFHKIYTQQIPPLKTVAEVISDLAGWNRTVMDRLLEGSGTLWTGDVRDPAVQARSRATRGLERLAGMQGLSGRERELVQELRNGSALAGRIQERLWERIEAEDQKAAYRVFREEFTPLLNGMETKLDGVFRIRNKRLLKAWISSEESCRRGIRRICWVFASFFVFMLVLLVWMTWNIGNRRRMVSALQESEEKYRSLIENNSEIIYSIDNKGLVTYVSPSVESFLGYKPSEVMNRNFREFVAGPDVPRLLEHFQTTRSSIPVVETRLLNRSGEVRWMRHSSRRILQGSRMVGVYGVLTDITDLKRAEKALRTSEQEKGIILDSMPDRVVHYDRDKRILWANPVAAECWGLPRDSLKDRNCQDLTGGCTKGCDRCPVEKSLKTMRPEEGEVSAPDGKVWMVRCNPVLNDNRDMTGVLEVSRDITEKKKLEEELLKTQKLESIGNLAGGVAHHFNNLLTGIAGNIQLARMDTEPGNKISQLLEKAEDAVFRSKELTSRLIAFSSSEEPVKRMTSIWELLKSTSDFALSGSRARCERDVSEKLWAVEVDETQMTQALGALITNASQAMPEGGVVRICAENIDARPEGVHPVEKGKYVRIRVEDQGTGISRENLTRIFEPFFTTRDRSSGLGLSSAYSIIKGHKGTLTVESDLGQGSIFNVYLPASEKVLPRKKEEPRKIRTFKGKVLIMDDEAMIRRSLGEMLERLGFDVEKADEGNEAVGLYREAKKEGTPFDLIILDLTIPGGMGGREALKRIMEIDPQVRAVVSSGYSRDPVLTRYWEFGFRGAVPKPYRFSDLKDTLEAVLET